MFDVPKYESMEAIAKSGDPTEAYKAAFTIGSYVKESRINESVKRILALKKLNTNNK